MTECTCIDGDSGEYNDFHHVSMETARENRRRVYCCECGLDIAPGDQYELATGKTHGDPDIWTAKTCCSCARVRDSVMCGFTYGMLWASIHGAICGRRGDPDYFCVCPDHLGGR